MRKSLHKIRKRLSRPLSKTVALGLAFTLFFELIIEMHNIFPDEPITIVGHSHGGNVAILAANFLQLEGYHVDYLITINTPVRSDYQVNPGAVGMHLQIWQIDDPVQDKGGDWVNIPDHWKVVSGPLIPMIVPTTYEGSYKGTGEYGPAGRIFDDASNLAVPMLGPWDFHDTHNDPMLWRTWLYQTIQDQKNKQLFGNPMKDNGLGGRSFSPNGNGGTNGSDDSGAGGGSDPFSGGGGEGGGDSGANSTA